MPTKLNGKTNQRCSCPLSGLSDLLQAVLKLTVGVHLECLLRDVLVDTEADVVGRLEGHGPVASGSGPRVLLRLKLVLRLLALHVTLSN